MSIDAMSWAFRQNLPPAEKLVLLSLADHHNAGTGICIPGQASIAEQTSMSVRTVQRHLQSLEQRGLIVRRARFRPEGRGRTSDGYTLQGDRLAGSNQPDKPGTTKATNQDDQHDTVVVAEPEGNRKKNLIAAAPRKDIIFESVAEACGWTLDSLTQSARGQLNRSAKELRDIGATPEQIAGKAKGYRKQYPTMTLSPSALVKHWAALDDLTKPKRQSAWDSYERQDYY